MTQDDYDVYFDRNSSANKINSSRLIKPSNKIFNKIFKDPKVNKDLIENLGANE